MIPENNVWQNRCVHPYPTVVSNSYGAGHVHLIIQRVMIRANNPNIWANYGIISYDNFPDSLYITTGRQTWCSSYTDEYVLGMRYNTSKMYWPICGSIKAQYFL